VKTDIETVEKNKVLLKVEVDSKEIGKAINQAYKSIAKKISIPGFRKGKIPKQVIDIRIGKEPVYQEALREMLPVYYNQAIKSSGIEPIDQPEFDVVQIEEGKPLLFNVKVEVKPEVKLGEYKGVEVTKEKAEVKEEEVERQLEAMREKVATLEIAPSRSLKKGDFALMNFEGTVDGKPVEGGSGEDYLLEIGSQTFVPGVEEQLIGMRKGEIKDVYVDIPEDYHAKQIAGKRVKFRILLKEIKQKKLPEVNDEFAKQVSGFKTLDELKQDIRAKLSQVKEALAQTQVRENIVKKIAEKAEVEIPDTLVGREMDIMLQDFAFSLQAQGINLQQYMDMANLTPEAMREKFKEDARRRVKSKLVLEAIAKAEGFEVTESEVEKEVETMATRIGKPKEELQKRLEEAGEIEVIKESIRIRKTVDWLVEEAKIIEKKSRRKKTSQSGKEKEQKTQKKSEAKKK
jgi:trigger factor